jgi:hypothetical protein
MRVKRLFAIALKDFAILWKGFSMKRFAIPLEGFAIAIGL